MMMLMMVGGRRRSHAATTDFGNIFPSSSFSHFFSRGNLPSYRHSFSARASAILPPFFIFHAQVFFHGDLKNGLLLLLPRNNSNLDILLPSPSSSIEFVFGSLKRKKKTWPEGAKTFLWWGDGGGPFFFIFCAPENLCLNVWIKLFCVCGPLRVFRISHFLGGFCWKWPFFSFVFFARPLFFFYGNRKKHINGFAKKYGNANEKEGRKVMGREGVRRREREWVRETSMRLKMRRFELGAFLGRGKSYWVLTFSDLMKLVRKVMPSIWEKYSLGGYCIFDGIRKCWTSMNEGSMPFCFLPPRAGKAIMASEHLDVFGK